MKEKTGLAIVGGGSGGHIMPIIALAEELTSRKKEFLVIGGQGSREQELFKELGIEAEYIPTGKWRRGWQPGSLLLNLRDLWRVFVATWLAWRLLRRYKIKTVFSKSGPVALPVVLAAVLGRRRLVIHESDVSMGLTNRISSRFASKILTGFDPKVMAGSDERYLQVGIPLRRTMRQSVGLKIPRKSRPLILVIGGIQGASAINRLVRQSLESLVKVTDVVHITGENEFEAHKQFAANASEEVRRAYRPFGYVSRELPYYLASADLIVSRASATTIAEAAIFSRAVYLIPNPNAANNHQLANAKVLAETKAAVYDEQYRLTGEVFSQKIADFLRSPEQLSSLGENLYHYFGRSEAVDKILAQCLETS